MIDWNKVYKLKANEFSEDPNKYADPKLIYSLGNLRKLVNQKMLPSPIKGTLARFGGSNTSQHYVGEDNLNITRLTTASDEFIEGIPFSNYSIILSSGLFNGIGIYLDTKGPDGLPWIMFHLDIRKRGYTSKLPLIWIAEKIYNFTTGKKTDTVYRYPQTNPKYWNLFHNYKLFQRKEFGVRI